MENILNKAIQSAQQSEKVFTKFIKPNDTGATGGHQAGFHLHKSSWPLYFDTPGVKGVNKDKLVKIKWQDDFETESRFIYYGVGTRDEYRLTRFGKGFPYLTDDNVGDLLIICKASNDYYLAYVLQTDDDIDDFLTALNISSTETNTLIRRQTEYSADEQLLSCFKGFMSTLTVDFPNTVTLAQNSRVCYNSVFSINSDNIRSRPDKIILEWINAEYQLFKTIENNRYNHIIRTPFESVEQLIEIANTILNRRKSRAGKSLEHHLSEIFKTFNLLFETQAITEANKKPDFLFPNSSTYRSSPSGDGKLTMLASKTTCKDRWRQILNEADKIRTKHLFTLQQGISKNQLSEMYRSGVCLVVPAPYLSSFPSEYQSQILTLSQFVNQIQANQAS